MRGRKLLMQPKGNGLSRGSEGWIIIPGCRIGLCLVMLHCFGSVGVLEELMKEKCMIGLGDLGPVQKHCQNCDSI